MGEETTGNAGGMGVGVAVTTGAEVEEGEGMPVAGTADGVDATGLPGPALHAARSSPSETSNSLENNARVFMLSSSERHYVQRRSGMHHPCARLNINFARQNSL
jgi:hypothetical protein